MARGVSAFSDETLDVSFPDRPSVQCRASLFLSVPRIATESCKEKEVLWFRVLLAPPTSPSLQRPRRRSWSRPAESPLFRGVCESCGFDRAPETALVNQCCQRKARLSLRPSVTVPFGPQSG